MCFELFALYVILRAWKNGALYIVGAHYTVCLGEWKFSSVIVGYTDWGKKLDSKLISSPWYYLNANPCLEKKLYFFTLILFNFTILYWFCHISKWICHRYICVPHPEPSSFLPPCTIPLGHPSAPAPSIQYRASNLDWQLISYMIVYIFQCHSPKSSHRPPLPQSSKDCSIHLCLFCCLVYMVIVTIFLNCIYMR